MATKTAKAESIQLNLSDLVDRYGASLTAYHKPVNFDHAHVAATAYVFVLETPEGLRITSCNAYNGCLTPKTAAVLDRLEGGNLVKDPEAFLAGLVKREYKSAIDAAKKARTRLKAADPANLAPTGSRRGRRKAN